MEEFNWAAAKVWLDCLQLLGLIAIGVYTHITQRSKANAQGIERLDQEAQERLEAVRKHVSGIERRVDVLESRQAQAPTHGDLAILHKRVTSATEAMERLAGEFHATNRQLGLIHEHLLNDKRGD